MPVFIKSQAALREAERLLRPPVAAPASDVRWKSDLLRLLAVIAMAGFAYGAAMGSFGGLGDGRWRQLLYSGAKAPLLLLVTFCLSAPSFFVANTLAGVRDDLGEVFRAILHAQAVVTIVLVSLAPYVLLWYASTANYQQAVAINGIMFLVASLTGQLVLRRLYRPLRARNPRHAHLLRLWLVIYVFIGIQMGWVLRPFVGSPTLEPQFFRSHMWGNAYVHVLSVLKNVARGKRTAVEEEE